MKSPALKKIVFRIFGHRNKHSHGDPRSTVRIKPQFLPTKLPNTNWLLLIKQLHCPRTANYSPHQYEWWTLHHCWAPFSPGWNQTTQFPAQKCPINCRPTKRMPTNLLPKMSLRKHLALIPRNRWPLRGPQPPRNPLKIVRLAFMACSLSNRSNVSDQRQAQIHLACSHLRIWRTRRAVLSERFVCKRIFNDWCTLWPSSDTSTHFWPAAFARDWRKWPNCTNRKKLISRRDHVVESHFKADRK